MYSFIIITPQNEWMEKNSSFAFTFPNSLCCFTRVLTDSFNTAFQNAFPDVFVVSTNVGKKGTTKTSTGKDYEDHDMNAIPPFDNASSGARP